MTHNNSEYQIAFKQRNPSYNKSYNGGLKPLTIEEQKFKSDKEQEQKDKESHRKTIFSGGFENKLTIELGINYHYQEGEIL